MITPESPEFDQARFNEITEASDAAGRIGDYLRSRDLCRELLAMKPSGGVNKGITLYLAGRIEYLTGNIPHGIQLLEEATIVFPGNMNAFRWLFKAYWENGMRWKAPWVFCRSVCSIPQMAEEWERQKSMGLKPLVKY